MGINSGDADGGVLKGTERQHKNALQQGAIFECLWCAQARCAVFAPAGAQFFFWRRRSHACVARTLRPPCTAVERERMAIPTKSQPWMPRLPHLPPDPLLSCLILGCEMLGDRSWLFGGFGIVGLRWCGVINTITRASLTGTTYQINFCVRSSV